MPMTHQFLSSKHVRLEVWSIVEGPIGVEFADTTPDLSRMKFEQVRYISNDGNWWCWSQTHLFLVSFHTRRSPTDFRVIDWQSVGKYHTGRIQRNTEQVRYISNDWNRRCWWLTDLLLVLNTFESSRSLIDFHGTDWCCICRHYIGPIEDEVWTG